MPFLMKICKVISVLSFLTLNLIWVEAESAPNGKVNFGVNGYPLNPTTGYHESLEQQISQLKILGLRTYRVYVDPAKTDRFDRLSQLIAIAQQQRYSDSARTGRQGEKLYERGRGVS